MVCVRICIFCCIKPMKSLSWCVKNSLYAYGMSKSIRTATTILTKKITVVKKKYIPKDNSSVVLEHKVASSVIKQLNSEFNYLYGPLLASRTDSYDAKKINKSNQIIQHETPIPITDPSKDIESIKPIGSESSNKVKVNNPLKGDLNIVPNFPLLNKSVFSQGKLELEISELNSLRKYLEEKSALKVPSVTSILQKTMPPYQVEILRRWQEKMIEQLGEDGFEKYKAELFETGKSLHSSIQNFLSSTPEEELQVKEVNEGHWKSLKAVFPQISEVKLLEERISHPFLCYRGIVDCFAKYRDHLVVIDWKTSKKKKYNLSNTFDNPVQIAAYVGAMNFDTRFQYLVNKGLLVIAYENGDPATIHFMDDSSMLHYWKEWLKRVKLYWETNENS